MIAIVAFVLGGGVATIVALVRSDGSAQGNLGGRTRTESSPGTQAGLGSEQSGDGLTPRDTEGTSTKTFSEVPLGGTPNLSGLGFQSPTGNLRCSAQGAHGTAIECVRLNDGLTVNLDSVGPPTVIPVRGEFLDLPTLGYGETWGVSPFTCTSSTGGIECESNESGMGFFLNRTTFRPLTR